MAYVEPIADKQHIKKAARFIKDNFDPAYALIWQIGIESGYRITDITELKYSNIDHDNCTIKVAENKGTRSNQARARLKVLEQVKNELIATYSNDSQRMMQVYITKPKDVYSLIPEDLKPLIDARITTAVSKAPVKYRTAKLSAPTMIKIKKRGHKYNFIDDGFIFARSTLKSNRARNTSGVITRQSCYRVFSQLTGFMLTLGQKVRIACHSLRKIFARHLYTSSGNNIGLLMKVIGHSSPEMSLRYIGINDNEQLNAMDTMFEYMKI
jgi:integrase